MITLLSVGSENKSYDLECDYGGNKEMNQYITGAVIRKLREKNNITQLQLAERLRVSDKTISKWETGVSHS